MQKWLSGLLAALMLMVLPACVDQHPQKDTQTQTQVAPRLIATSYATLCICDALGLELVAIPETSGDVPARYLGLPTIGTAMAPDAEAIAMLSPDAVIGPDTLAETIEPTYQAAGVPYTFINLQSVQGMYDSIAMLGDTYGAQAEAQAMVAQFEDTLSAYQATIADEASPRVLVLMGLPGAYIACTPNSYVGSLVALAGADNVVKVDTNENFVSWNTEALLALDPDVILLTAHGLPDEAMAMFAQEFATNDIWKHFRAVENGQVYQLDHTIFGMSCTFEWTQALEVLHQILFEGTYAPYDMGGTA